MSAGGKFKSERLCDRVAPLCPHCGNYMGDAAVTLDDIAQTAGGFADPVALDAEGYAPPRYCVRGLVAVCPSCDKPSIVQLTGEHITLIAARTSKDITFKQGSAA